MATAATSLGLAFFMKFSVLEFYIFFHDFSFSHAVVFSAGCTGRIRKSRFS